MKQIDIEERMFAESATGRLIGLLQGILLAIVIVVTIFGLAYNAANPPSTNDIAFFALLLLLCIIFFACVGLGIGPVFLTSYFTKKYLRASRADISKFASREIMRLEGKIKTGGKLYNSEHIAQMRDEIKELQKFL